MEKLSKLIIIIFIISTSSAYAGKYKKFNMELEGGLAFNNNLSTNKPILDRDEDSFTATYKRQKKNHSYYGGAGVYLDIMKNDQVLLEVLYGYISTPKIKLKQSVTDDDGATEADISDNVNLHRHSVLANVYVKPYKFNINRKVAIAPFIQLGAGVGVSSIDSVKFTELTSNTTIGKMNGNTETNFAWNVGAGVNVGMFSLGYRFIDAGIHKARKKYNDLIENEIDTFPESIKINLKSHLVYLGFNF